MAMRQVEVILQLWRIQHLAVKKDGSAVGASEVEVSWSWGTFNGDF